MIRFLFLFIAITAVTTLWGQNTFRAVVLDSETQEPLAGASAVVKGTTNGASAGENGVLQINNIPNGQRVIVFSFIGYHEKSVTLNFPLNQTNPLTVELSPTEEEMEEVIVSATRSSRTINDVPTRIEAISGEELEEKGNMKPGDIRMMLNESTGIQTQQTSATSYNSSIRIQGLDGKYTQILKDGYPLYSGFSGGLGLLQIVPLDLKQVEVIKGASSTLYGGGAIAGLVNLVSKTPTEKRELNFMANGTSALGLDLSGFYSQKHGKKGITVFTSYNTGKPYDPANIGLTAIPEFNRITFNPKLFIWFTPRTSLDIGLNTTVEERTGGDILYIKGKGDDQHSYYEKNKTNRISSQLGLKHKINEASQLNIKNSFSYYDREIRIPGYIFSGKQQSSFTEATYSINAGKNEWIIGANLWTEQFKQDKAAHLKVDYNYITSGLFVQNTWNISENIALETGVRADYQNKYSFFFLPRLSAMVKIKPGLTARLGGGLGYKAPTVFTEDAERMQFRNVLPINVSQAKAEESAGGNLDINYRTTLNESMTFSINALLFYTRINKPLILTDLQNSLYEFQQTGGFIDTKGMEANVKLTYNDFKLFIGYTLADVNQKKDGEVTSFPLVAKHRLNNVLMYEIEDKLKVGLEAYYYSKQHLSDGATGKPYWLCGVMAEKLWEHFSLFVNFENILDTCQTKFDTIYTGNITNPVFRDIYAPVDGFVVNGGIKIKL